MNNLLPVYRHDWYRLRRQVLALTGKLRLYDPSGQLVLYSEQRIFRLKEDIRVYSNEQKTQEMLHIQARQVIDFSAAYDVHDSTTGKMIGTLKRKGFRSMLRDEWHIFDSTGVQTGVLIEDTPGLALLRRLLLGSLLPQNYAIMASDQLLVDLRQEFNLFRYVLVIDFSGDPQHVIDPRLGISAGILLATIEGRQD